MRAAKTGRSLRELAVRVVLLLLGLWIAHLGVTLFLQTDLGSDPFNVFIQGLYRALPWPAWAAMTHGRVHLLVSLLILVALLVIDRSYVGIGTVLCMALGGPIIDVFTLLLSPVLNGALPLPVRCGGAETDRRGRFPEAQRGTPGRLAARIRGHDL